MDALNTIQTSQVVDSVLGGKAQHVEHLARRGELLKASQEFEAYFLSYLMKIMRETVPKNPLTANKMGEVFHSFYDEEIGKRAAQAGGIGLSQYMLASLSENDTHLPPHPKSLISMKS